MHLSVLVSCCVLAARQLHPWRFELEFFPSPLPCGQPYRFCFEANPIWYSTIKFMKSHSAKCSLHKINGCDWGTAWKSARLNCTNLSHFRLTAGWFCGNLCIVMLWVACELLQFAAIQEAGMVKAFCRPHAHTINEQSKMATTLPPQTDVTSEKVTWLMENPRQQSQPAYRK